MYNKLDKYNVSNFEKIDDDLEAVEEFMIELESVRSVVKDIVNNHELTDDEEIELGSIYDKINKLYFLVESVKEYLKESKIHFSKIKDFKDKVSTKAIKLDDKSGLKIYIN